MIDIDVFVLIVALTDPVAVRPGPVTLVIGVGSSSQEKESELLLSR